MEMAMERRETALAMALGCMCRAYRLPLHFQSIDQSTNKSHALTYTVLNINTPTKA